jgi:hypothetical protein
MIIYIYTYISIYTFHTGYHTVETNNNETYVSTNPGRCGVRIERVGRQTDLHQKGLGGDLRAPGEWGNLYGDGSKLKTWGPQILVYS